MYHSFIIHQFTFVATQLIALGAHLVLDIIQNCVHLMEKGQLLFVWQLSPHIQHMCAALHKIEHEKHTQI